MTALWLTAGSLAILAAYIAAISTDRFLLAYGTLGLLVMIVIGSGFV